MSSNHSCFPGCDSPSSGTSTRTPIKAHQPQLIKLQNSGPLTTRHQIVPSAPVETTLWLLRVQIVAGLFLGFIAFLLSLQSANSCHLYSDCRCQFLLSQPTYLSDLHHLTSRHLPAPTQLTNRQKCLCQRLGPTTKWKFYTTSLTDESYKKSWKCSNLFSQSWPRKCSMYDKLLTGCY